MLRRLDAQGYRMTGPRARVVETIADQSGAFTAEGLVDCLKPEGVGRATVYRSLELLEHLGVLTRMHLDRDGCHGYTVCDEGHHHHLVCSQCHDVVPVDATEVEQEIQRLAERLKFRVDTHTLEFAGRCERCQGVSA